MSYVSFLYQLFAWMPWTGYYNSIIWTKLSEKATWQCNFYHYPKHANSCEASLAFPLHRHYHAVLYSASFYLTERLECNGKQAAIHSNTLNLRGRQIDHSLFFLSYLFIFYFVLFYLRKPRLSHFLHACLKNKKWRRVPHSAAVLAGQLSESILFHMHLVKPLLIIESLWLSGRALEREFRRFDVWFLMESQNYVFLCPTLETRKMNMFLHNFYIYLSYFLCSSYHS